MRFALALAGLGLLAFSGLSLFDLEWAGGLIVGGALVVLIWMASGRTQRLYVAIRQRQTRRNTSPGDQMSG